jgi:hypothetical protein
MRRSLYRCSWPQVGPWLSRFVVVGVLGVGCVEALGAPSVARDWDEQILSAIRLDRPHPPVHARNLFSLSVCMYDAWAAYDPVAIGYIYRGKHASADIGAARREAISYAAYRILTERYALSIAATNTLPALNAHMLAMGYDTNNISRDTSTPAGVGNSVYDAVSAWFIDDGARQTNNYVDATPSQGGYTPVNRDYLVTGMSGTTVTDINHWQPLAIADAVDQNGHPTGPLQKFLGSQWLHVRPFALSRTDPQNPWIDTGPMPRLGTPTGEDFRTNVVEVILRSSQLSPDDGAMIDISPGAFGNNTLGANDGTGHPSNPVTRQTYTPNSVKRGDFARVLAEFWADGPNSETPPGHWNVLANSVSDDPTFQKRLGGTGPALDDLEWDVKLYFALNAAVHDAACAAWGLKRYYDGWRPISAIRYMGQLGQCTDPTSPAYNTNGLPLIANLIELVTTNSAAPGGRHAGLTPGTMAIYTWPGQPANPTNQYSGVKWIQAADWLPYQKKTFVTPAFPGYISGHSTFSRAAAEILAAITGSPFFPGGMGTYQAGADSLKFEVGPTQPVELQWATYFDAADQAGLSRIWGGIHPPVDDLTGRRTGAECGQKVWALAQKFFDGSIANVPVTLSLKSLGGAQCEIHCSTVRGLFYTLQSTTDLAQPFTNEPSGATLAFDTSVVTTNSMVGPQKFFRALLGLTPGG